MMLNLHPPNPDHNRFYLAKLLLLIASLLIAACLNGCHNPYEIAKKRYATDHVDTTYVTVTTTIPRDSVVLKVKTDTTHLVETVKQGRATVTIIREPQYTTVYADCDSLTKTQRYITKTVTQEWGIDPRFKDLLKSWRTAFWVLLTVFAVAIIAYFLVYRIRLYITKRNGTTA